MLCVTASGLSTVAPNTLAKCFSSHSIRSMLSWHYVFLLSSSSWSCSTREFSDELGSNPTLAFSSVMIVTRALMMVFSAVSGNSTAFLSISVNAQMLIMTVPSPCLGGRWELYGPRDVQTPLRPACCRENSGQLISRILRQMSQLRMPCVAVLPRFKAIERNPPC